MQIDMRNNGMSKDRKAQESRVCLRYGTRAMWLGCTACARPSGERGELRLDVPVRTKP